MSEKMKKNSGNKTTDVIQLGYELGDNYVRAEIGTALTVDEAFVTMDVEQLIDDKYKLFYVDTDSVRSNTIRSFERILKNPLTTNQKLLFTGFTGSGKTTELIRLCYSLEDSFNVVIFSVKQRLKVSDVTIEAILFEIIEDVLNYLELYGLSRDDEAREIIKKIYDWCKETKIVDESTEKNALSTGIGINLVKGLFLRAKVESNFSGSTTTSATRIEERKLKNLIFECNRIFDYLYDKTGKETLVIIDDFEKIPFDRARNFYISNTLFLKELRCSMVMTIPVELVYHTEFSLLQGVLGESVVLPMIKVKDVDGSHYKPGLKLLENILKKRIDLTLFEDECYKKAIHYSGGSIRDLFRIIHEAVINEESGLISAASMERAVYKYKDILSSRIHERDEPGISISFDDYLDVLFDIAEGNKRQPHRTTALQDLLRIRAVMKYNDKGFFDIHPLLDEFVKLYKEKREKKEKKQKEKKNKESHE